MKVGINTVGFSIINRKNNEMLASVSVNHSIHLYLRCQEIMLLTRTRGYQVFRGPFGIFV